MEKPSALKSLAEFSLNNFRSIPDKAGVYVVFWVKEGKPRPIPRILGVDERGILYIGSTRSKRGLRERMKNLCVSIEMVRGRKEGRKHPHTFGPSLMYTGLHEVIGDDELEIFYKRFSFNEAEFQERLAIFEYTRKYGEPPPLNLQMGRRYFMILGLGILGKSRLANKLDQDLKAILGL